MGCNVHDSQIHLSMADPSVSVSYGHKQKNSCIDMQVSIVLEKKGFPESQ